MFSSLSLSKYSPKNLLASYLSLSLAQIFDVDPKRVEANLVRDARVVLNDVDVRERRLGGGGEAGGGCELLMGGSISQIEFSWAWDTSALIKDAVLTVRGVSIDVRVVRGDGTEEDGTGGAALGAADDCFSGGGDATADATSTSDDSGDKPPSDWKARYTQQIIDHLTLAVSDVTVVIHIDDEVGGKDVVLQSKGMELKTLVGESGVEDEASKALMQVISVASIEAWIERRGGDESSKSRYPIFSPFGYEANVTRISGRRFLDGILSGLLVEGRSSLGSSCHAPSTIRVYAGIEQVVGLSSLQHVLLLLGQDGAQEEVTDTTHGDVDPGVDPSQIKPKKSIFNLPFQSIEVVLENETNLRLEGCDLKYSTDGSELLVECTQGVWVDDAPFSKEGKWILDLVSNEMVLSSLPPQEYDGEDFYDAQGDGPSPVSGIQNTGDVRLNLSIQMLQKIYGGVMMILPHCSGAIDKMGDLNNHQASSTSSPWLVKSVGNTVFRFTGREDTWVEVVATSPKLCQTHVSTMSFECESTKVKSNAGFSVDIPKILTDADGNLVIEHRVSSTFDTMDTFQVLQRIANDVVDIMGDGSSGASNMAPSDTPDSNAGTSKLQALSIAGFDVKFQSLSSVIHVSRICICNGITIGLIQVKDIFNTSFEASCIKGGGSNVTVGEVKQFSYDKMEYLAVPIKGVTAVFERGEVLSVAVKQVHLKYPEETNVIVSNADSPRKQATLCLPVSVNLNIEHVRVSSASKKVEVFSFDFWARPMPDTNAVGLDLSLQSLKAKIISPSKVTVSCGKINSSFEVGPGGVSDSTLLPGIEVSSASMTANDIVHLSSSVGHLTKPLDIIELTYGANTVMIKTDKVLFCPKSSQENSGRVVVLPISVYFQANRFVWMSDFGPGKPGFCFDGPALHLTPKSQTSMKVNAICTFMQVRGENQAECAAKGMKLNTTFDTSIDECSGLEELYLEIGEISSLSIPGQVKLIKHIPNTVVQLRNRVLHVQCELVHMCLQSTEQPIGTKDGKVADANVPFPLCIEVNHICVEGQSTNITCKGFKTQFKTAKTSSSLHVEALSVVGKIDTNSIVVNGIALSSKWEGSAGQGGHEILAPYLGLLVFAQIELEEIKEFRTSSFHLITPLRRPTLLFQEGFIVSEFMEIELEMKSSVVSGTDGPQTNEEEAAGIDKLPVPAGFNVTRLRLKTPTSDLYFDNLGIDFVPSLTDAGARGHAVIQFDGLEESSMISTKKWELHVNVVSDSLPKAKALNNVLPGIDRVERATLKVKEVTSLSVGKGRLSRPLHNLTLSYEGGNLTTSHESGIKFELLNLDQGVVIEVEGLQGRMQPDPFDQSIKCSVQINDVSSTGSVSCNATGINLIATFVSDGNENVLSSKPFAFPSFGYISSAVMDISAVSSINVQNMGYLKGMTRPRLHFENDIVKLTVPDVSVQKSEAIRHIAPAKLQDKPVSYELPCRVCISIDKLQAQDLSLSREAKCTNLNVMMEPKETIHGSGIGIQVIVDTLKATEGSTVIDVPRGSVSGFFQLNNLTRVDNLSIGIEKAQLAADFSSAHWSDSTEVEEQIILLPHASIPKFELTLKYSGLLVDMEDACIAFEKFQGGVNATSSQIKSHYINIVKTRIPYLISKANIAGCNVADSVGVAAGRALMNSSVLGATVGVASCDLVGSAVSMGKQSRGASESDGYQFGDLTRGVVASVSNAKKSGAEMRGGEKSYQFGDITSGMTKAGSEYVSDNKCRLAGATGSAIGMGVGAALLGPVGFVAGSMLGGSAASKSVKAIGGADPQKKPPEAHSANTTAQEPPNTPGQRNKFYEQEIPDFFSSDYSGGAAQSSSLQQHTQVQVHNQRNQGTASGYPSHHQQHQLHGQSHSSSSHQAHNPRKKDEGYRFGDITRGIVAKGKNADGRSENDKYKFGDFTRGLFK